MKRKGILIVCLLVLLCGCGGEKPYVPPVDGRTAESAVLYRACDDEKPEKVTLTGEEIDGAVAAVSGMTARGGWDKRGLPTGGTGYTLALRFEDGTEWVCFCYDEGGGQFSLNDGTEKLRVTGCGLPEVWAAAAARAETVPLDEVPVLE